MSDITRTPAKADDARIDGLANEIEMSAPSGGARRDRTDDLLLAKQALSQLSYGPAPVSVRLSVFAGLPLPACRVVARGSWYGPPSLRFGPAAFASLTRAKAGGPGKI